MLKIQDAAVESGVSRYTLNIWAKSGLINAVRMGGSRGKILINMDSLYNYLENSKLSDNDEPQAVGGIRVLR